MNSEEAGAKFRLSQQLFSKKQYQDALRILEELESAFPNTKDLIYSQALCLAKLGRRDQALELCRDLVANYSDGRGQELMDSLAARLDGPHSFDAADLGETLSVEPHCSPPQSVRDTAPKRTAYLVAGSAAVVLAGVAVVLGFMYMRRGPSAPVHPAAINWRQSYGEGMSAASESSSPVLLFFHNGASEDSRRMEEKVFGEPSIIAMLDGYTCIKVDFDPEHEARAKRNVELTPTVIVLDNLGKELYRHAGYVPARPLYDAIINLDVKPVKELEFATHLLVAAAGLWLLFAIFPLFFTLLISNKLPTGVLWKDFLSTALVALGIDVAAGLVVRFVPFVGGLGSTVFLIATLNKLYDMAFFDFLVYFAFRFLFGSLFIIVVLGLIGPSIVEFLMQLLRLGAF